MSALEECYDIFGLSPSTALGDNWSLSLIRFLCDEEQVIAYWVIPFDAIIVALVLLYYRRLDTQISRGTNPLALRNRAFAVTVLCVIIFAVFWPPLAAYENVIQLVVTFLSAVFIVWRNFRFIEKYIRNLR